MKKFTFLQLSCLKIELFTKQPISNIYADRATIVQAVFIIICNQDRRK